MFWTKRIWPNVIQDIILLAKFMLDKNTLDKPILDELLFSLIANYDCKQNEELYLYLDDHNHNR